MLCLWQERLQKEKKAWLGHTKKYVKLKETDIESLEPQPVPKRRIRPGDSLSARFQAGDDFVQEVRKLPRDFQDKINEEIETLNKTKK